MIEPTSQLDTARGEHDAKYHKQPGVHETGDSRTMQLECEGRRRIDFCSRVRVLSVVGRVESSQGSYLAVGRDLTGRRPSSGLPRSGRCII